MRPLFTLCNGLTLILASASPRRRQFLKEWGLPFQVHSANVPEPRPASGETPDDYTRRAAVSKAQAVARDLTGQATAPLHCIILAADTAVAVEGDILGKPDNPDHALCMLERLNGREHEVISAVCLLVPRNTGPEHPPATVKADVFDHWRQLVFSNTSRVFFYRWPHSTLQAYIHTGEPVDKAGAYAIQGQGAFLVERVEGSWSTVVGLPVTELACLLLHYGLIAPATHKP